MNIKEFFELFFVIAAGIAMPFIVIGSYFNLVSNKKERSQPLAIFFLIISILYALIYTYFAWKSLRDSASWKKIVEKKDKSTEEKGR